MTGVVYETCDLYRFGMPVWCLSTVFMLWSSYGRPGKILISEAKTDDWAVVELRDTRLAAAIVDTVKEAQLKKVNQPEKIVKL